MKILHWNIHGWRDAEGIDNVDRVSKLIGDHDPDVVSLVEVDETWGQPMNIERVANELGYHWAFIPAFEYRQEGGFGNALLSKTPFLSVQQRDLLPPSLYDGTEPSEPRAVLIVEVERPAGKLAIAATHFPRYSDTLRISATKQLLRIMREASTPWIVCGDFNQAPDAMPTGELSIVPSESTPTYPDSNPVESIDYAIASRIAVSGTVIPGIYASDHLPILVRSP